MTALAIILPAAGFAQWRNLLGQTGDVEGRLHCVLAVRIERATDGKVPASSWVDTREGVAS